MDKSEEAAQTVLSRKKPNAIGFYEPCPPSFDLVFKQQAGSCPIPVNMKVKQQTSYKGIKSGKRSAIYVDESSQRQYRLKGCGNLTDFFTTQATPYPPDGQEIRGCMFKQTAIRDLYLCDRIGKILQQNGMKCGNIPVGYFQYKFKQNSIVDQQIKQCAVFQTQGDKRLATHLLAGMEKLLLEISQQEQVKSLLENEINKQLFTVFPACRQNSDMTIKQTLSQVSFTTFDEYRNETLEEFVSKGVYKDNSGLLNLLEKVLSFQDQVVDLQGTQVQFSVLLKHMLEIYQKVGYETGVIKRLLQDNRISWGYFVDHNPFEPHCNAHPNNLIIVLDDPKILTAALDFDLAFDEEGFINIIDDENPQKFGKFDKQLFESWVNSERHAMEEALAGQENMANFQYKTQQDQRKQVTELLQIAFRDQLVLGFRLGFERQNLNVAILNEVHYKIILAALDLTKHIET